MTPELGEGSGSCLDCDQVGGGEELPGFAQAGHHLCQQLLAGAMPAFGTVAVQPVVETRVRLACVVAVEGI